MRRHAALILLVCLVMLFSSCAVEGEDATVPETNGPTLSVSPTPHPRDRDFGLAWFADEVINPLTAKSSVNDLFTTLLYEGLFNLDEKGLPVARLAASYTVSGNKYLIALRPGVLFSDGSKLTAEDVVYSLELARSSASPYSPRFYNVTGIFPEGGKIAVTTATPDGSLACLLDIPIIKKDTGKDSPAIGTGRYYFATGKGRERYLAVNKKWNGGGKMPFERIELVECPDLNSLIFAFESHSADLVNTDSLNYSPVSFTGSYETSYCLSGDLYIIGFNTARAPFDNSAARSAVGYSLDRKKLASDTLHAFATPAFGFFPEETAFYSASSARWSYSPEKARALFSEAGLAGSNGNSWLNRDGEPFEPVIIVNTGSDYKLAAAGACAEQLRSVGIRAIVQVLSWEDYKAALSSGNYDMYFGETRPTRNYDYAYLAGSGSLANAGGYKNTEMDKLFAAFRAQSPDKAKAAAQELSALMVTDAPVVPVCRWYDLVLTHDSAAGNIKPSAYDFFANIEEWTKPAG